ncbi:unnamed protein product [Amoebophrya sp. A25]|nr:unnamed protein product [Amoebophrya sp. A25]|eukprot:GSA25T00004891001.1
MLHNSLLCCIPCGCLRRKTGRRLLVAFFLTSVVALDLILRFPVTYKNFAYFHHNPVNDDVATLYRKPKSTGEGTEAAEKSASAAAGSFWDSMKLFFKKRADEVRRSGYLDLLTSGGGLFANGSSKPLLARKKNDAAKLTVLINQFQRPSCLRKQLRVLRRCAIVHSVYINWFDVENEPPKDVAGFMRGSEDAAPSSRETTEFVEELEEEPDYAIFPASSPEDIPKKGGKRAPYRLSDKYRPHLFPTDAVFVTDVDMFYSCHALQYAYNVWIQYNENEVERQPSSRSRILSTAEEGRRVLVEGQETNKAGNKTTVAATTSTAVVTAATKIVRAAPPPPTGAPPSSSAVVSSSAATSSSSAVVPSAAMPASTALSASTTATSTDKNAVPAEIRAVPTRSKASKVAKISQTVKAVGFHPRFLSRTEAYDWSLSYRHSADFLHNTVFITKGALVHKEVFRKIWKDEYAPLRDLIDREFQGGDLLASYVLAMEYGPHGFRALCPAEKFHLATAASCSANERPSSLQRKDPSQVLHNFDAEADMIVEYDVGGAARAKLSWKLAMEKRKMIRRIFGGGGGGGIARLLEEEEKEEEDEIGDKLEEEKERKGSDRQLGQKEEEQALVEEDADHHVASSNGNEGDTTSRELLPVPTAGVADRVSKALPSHSAVDDHLAYLFQVPELTPRGPRRDESDFALKSKISEFQTYYPNSIIWERQSRYYMDFWRWADREVYKWMNQLDCASAPWRSVPANEFWFMQHVQ